MIMALRALEIAVKLGHGGLAATKSDASGCSLSTKAHNRNADFWLATREPAIQVSLGLKFPLLAITLSQC
jgi:hypothetical protein